MEEATQRQKHPGGRPREKKTEWVITHHSVQPEGSKGHWTVVYPPAGDGWEVRELTASNHSTHILWKRTVPIEGSDESGD